MTPLKRVAAPPLFHLLSAVAFLLLSTAVFSCPLFSGSEACEAPDLDINEDEPTVESEIEVLDDFEIGDVTVQFQITHTWIEDLTVVVGSPEGTEVTVHDQGGGMDDDVVTTFDDDGVVNGSRPYDCVCHMQPSGPGELADFDGESPEGFWVATITDDTSDEDGVFNRWCVNVCEDDCPTPFNFLRGDFNGDGTLFPLIDALGMLSFAFQGGAAAACEKSSDADGNGIFFSLLDAIFLLDFGFSQGAAPPEPYPRCGEDTEDLSSALSCDEDTCE